MFHQNCFPFLGGIRHNSNWLHSEPLISSPTDSSIYFNEPLCGEVLLIPSAGTTGLSSITLTSLRSLTQQSSTAGPDRWNTSCSNTWQGIEWFTISDAHQPRHPQSAFLIIWVFRTITPHLIKDWWFHHSIVITLDLMADTRTTSSAINKRRKAYLTAG